MTGAVEVPLATLGKEISARIAAGDKAVAKGEDHYRAAGLQLIQAKARVKAEGGSFIAFYQQFGMKKETVGKCIAIADGRKTLSGIRAGDAERQAKKSERDRELISVSHGNAVRALVLADPAEARIDEVDQLRTQLAEALYRMNSKIDENADLLAFVAHHGLFSEFHQCRGVKAYAVNPDGSAKYSTFAEVLEEWNPACIERDEALAEVARLKAEVERLKTSTTKPDPVKAIRSTTAVIRHPEPAAQPLKAAGTIAEFDPSKIGFVARIARYNDPAPRYST